MFVTIIVFQYISLRYVNIFTINIIDANIAISTWEIPFSINNRWVNIYDPSSTQLIKYFLSIIE